MSDAHDGPESLSRSELEDLLRVAHAAKALAHSPYSRVQVGAALLAADGQVFSGCNVENASYGLTVCAERVAVVKAVSSGSTRFRAIAIATNREQALMPCGACRQVLREFGAELAIVCQGSSGATERASLAELLPRAFSRSDLR
jgi:cytidine deaminase